jgi:hypothetical protein
METTPLEAAMYIIEPCTAFVTPVLPNNNSPTMFTPTVASVVFGALITQPAVELHVKLVTVTLENIRFAFSLGTEKITADKLRATF